MTAASYRRRTQSGPDVVRAAIALAIAGACVGLLIFMLSPPPGDGAKGPADTDQLHWRAPAGSTAAKLIPI